MIKKILPISVFVLLVVIIILLGLQNMLNKNKISQSASITPTLYQGKGGNSLSLRGDDSLKAKNANISQITEDQFRSVLPVFAPNFSLEYSPRLQKYVLTTQDETGKNDYSEWLNQNPSYLPFLNTQQVIIARQTVKELHQALDVADMNKLTPEQKAIKDTTIMTSIFETLINFPQTLIQSINSVPNTELPPESPTIQPAVAPSPTPKKSTSNPPNSAPSKSYTYYSQCSGPYDNLPLPQGCTICNAGCGPTSVAMILSSYIDKSLTPPKTIALMEAKGARIGCFGSYISEIYSYLKGRGDLKVSDYIIPSEQGLTAKEIADDFKGYTKSGWTIFVLANFKTNGGGHYFWVTDVNSSGDILAYDPYYGKQQTPPISENKYTPAPYYRYAFAIKKS